MAGEAEKFNEPGGRLFPEEEVLEAGASRVVAGWEKIWIPTMLSAAFICIVGLTARPDTRLKTWAREEAEEREARLVEKLRGEAK